jgi:hypothetical protein
MLTFLAMGRRTVALRPRGQSKECGRVLEEILCMERLTCETSEVNLLNVFPCLGQCKSVFVISLRKVCQTLAQAHFAMVLHCLETCKTVLNRREYMCIVQWAEYRFLVLHKPK